MAVYSVVPGANTGASVNGVVVAVAVAVSTVSVVVAVAMAAEQVCSGVRRHTRSTLSSGSVVS